MTTEELLAMCDRITNGITKTVKTNSTEYGRDPDKFCFGLQEPYELAVALRTALADVQRLTKERDEWQRSNAAAVAALTRVACANEEWLPTYIAKAREMLAGKERDERLQAALRHFTAMEAERDAAIKEANRRDDKWKAGIEECCGCKIEFGFRTVGGPPTLSEFIAALRQRVPVACQPTAHDHYWWRESADTDWQPCWVRRGMDGKTLWVDFVARCSIEVKELGGEFATCPPPAGDKGG